MATQRIRINGKAYKIPALEDLSLDDILILDADLQDRYRSSWVKVQEYVSWSEKDPAETDAAHTKRIESHAMSTLMAGVTVWMVLRTNGNPDISMKEALAVSPTAIEEVVPSAPKDRQPKKGKSQSRKSSVPAVAPAVPQEGSSPETISSAQSANA